MILGTAGHIDHGKTTLIRALTGVDTDRLPEEKRRGITIELGFAPLELDGFGTLGVVDVPGHEAFVRTMLAGATGIDLALLVVAGDEGMMPQTREHLAILELLGVSAGVVAITKADLAEPDWLQLVTDDVRDALARGPLRDAAIVHCSAVSGVGLDALRDAIRDAARSVPARSTGDLFRMPIDRVFSVKGTGTVVTGTVWSGAVDLEDSVQLLPAGLSARVRGIESHGVVKTTATSGIRTAVALGGVDRADIEPRGAVLVRTADRWTPSPVVRADAALRDEAPVIGPRTRVRFHLGTADIGARIVAAGRPVGPGAQVSVRIMLDSAVVARAGDRFVIRTASPAATIGGGVITDPDPPRRRAKPWPLVGARVDQRLRWIVAESSGRGVAIASLAVRLGAKPSEVEEIVLAYAPDGRVGDRLYDSNVMAAVADHCRRSVADAHRDHPLEPGVLVQSVRSGVAASAELVDAVLARLVADGECTMVDGVVARAGWSPGSAPGDAAKIERVRSALIAAGHQPPAIDELSASLGDDTMAILKLLARAGEAVQVTSDRYFSAGAVVELTGLVRGALADNHGRPTSELREITGLTRKYIIPFLEYCDRVGVTVRQEDLRRLAPPTTSAGSV
ncbi:MAG: selenocysteine-specific translation elongation factor [Gemmatimonadetes bacterium]|nr:selenocysteine-specific translation elongation factor [Gemmatimonadota bacterium]